MTREIRLTRNLTLEERESVPDGSGGFDVAWLSRGTLWGEISASSGREDFLSDEIRPRVRYRIIVRAAPFGTPSRPRPDQRFREGARIFDILTVAEHDVYGRYLEIVSEEGVLP